MAVNPQRKQRRRRSHSSPRHAGRFMMNRRRRRHSNPNILRGGVNLLKYGLYALIALVLTRQLPQMFLGARNQGLIGYGANVGTTLVAAFLAGKFLGKDAFNAFMIGGGLYVANRLIGDYFSPVQKYLSLSGVGDPLALGDITQGYFPLPVPTDANGAPIIPQEIRALPAAGGGGPQPAPGPGKMSGVGSPSGRFGGRF